MATTTWRPVLLLLLLGAVAFSNVPGFDLVWDDRHFLIREEADALTRSLGLPLSAADARELALATLAPAMRTSR